MPVPSSSLVDPKPPPTGNKRRKPSDIGKQKTVSSITYYVCTRLDCGWTGSSHAVHRRARPHCPGFPSSFCIEKGAGLKAEATAFLARCTPKQRELGLPPDYEKPIPQAGPDGRIDPSKLYLSVPTGLQPGDEFEVPIGRGLRSRVTVPPGLVEGDVLSIPVTGTNVRQGRRGEPAPASSKGSTVDTDTDNFDEPGAEGGNPQSAGGNLSMLHACLHCRASKTACSDERPCTRCRRLGLECSSERGQPRKRACKSCHQAKVACGALFTDSCNRCRRLGLECVPRDPPAYSGGTRRKSVKRHRGGDPDAIAAIISNVSGVGDGAMLSGALADAANAAAAAVVVATHASAAVVDRAHGMFPTHATAVPQRAMPIAARPGQLCVDVAACASAIQMMPASLNEGDRGGAQPVWAPLVDAGHVSPGGTSPGGTNMASVALSLLDLSRRSSVSERRGSETSLGDYNDSPSRASSAFGGATDDAVDFDEQPMPHYPRTELDPALLCEKLNRLQPNLRPTLRWQPPATI